MKSASIRDRPADVVMPAHGVFVIQSIHSPDFTPLTMQHDFLKLIYVVRGIGRLKMGRSVPRVAAGDFITIPIRQTHRIEDQPREPLTLLVLCLTPDAAGLPGAMLNALPIGRVKPPPQMLDRIRTAFRRLLYEQEVEPIGFRTAQVATSQDLLIHLLRAANETTQSVTRSLAEQPADAITNFIAHLNVHFFEPMSIAAAAAYLGVSRRHFTQRFRERTGITFNQFIRQRRILHAQHLLSNTRHTVMTICFECGYDNLSTFYRAFKSVTGQSPAQWRSGGPTNCDQSISL